MRPGRRAARWIERRRAVPRSEDGAVMVVVAVSLMALMAMVATAVDGGILQNDRRDDQNVADHAALAASWASCQSLGDPVAAGLASAADNGFDNDGTTNIVAISEIGTHMYEASVRSNRDPAFSGTIGTTNLSAHAYAIARCVPGGPGGSLELAIFAGSQSCDFTTFDNPGQNSVINGRVHSRHDLRVGGSNLTINGRTTYVGLFANSGSNNVYNPPPQRVTRNGPDDPSDPLASRFNIADYYGQGDKRQLAQAQGLLRDAGNQEINVAWLQSRNLYNNTTGVVAPGLYVTTNKIVLGDSRMRGANVTFVSTSTIEGSGQDQRFTAWDPDGMLFFSNHQGNCGEFGVKIEGSRTPGLPSPNVPCDHATEPLFRGYFYSPRAMIEVAGQHRVFCGAIVGNEVRWNGSNETLHLAQLFSPGGPPSNVLME